jgi:hypothetical protein
VPTAETTVAPMIFTPGIALRRRPTTSFTSCYGSTWR